MRNYVGRVGVLAVVLGIGAIGGGAGFAWAEPDDSSSATEAGSSTSQPQSSTVEQSRQRRGSAPRPATASRVAAPARSAHAVRTPNGATSIATSAKSSGGRAAVDAVVVDAPVPISRIDGFASAPVVVAPGAARVGIDAGVPGAAAVRSVPVRSVPAALSSLGGDSATATPGADTPPVAGPIAAAAPAGLTAVPAVARLLNALRLSGFDSPLGWGALAVARDGTGRSNRLRSTATQDVTSAATALPAYAPGEVLVAWKPGATGNQRAQAMGLVKASVMARLGTQDMLKTDQGVVYRLKVPGGTEAAIKALSNNPAVAFVEPNYKVSLAASSISNDPYYTNGSLWGMESDDSPTSYGPRGTTNAYGSGAEEAWGQGVTGSRSVAVAVLDEGIQITHPDLAANIWTNPLEIAGDGIDNDGNGFVDDVHGWDFFHDDNSVYDAGEDAHGTHVAGTIGAVGGNGIGVSGINWNVSIISTKFLGPGGGYISDAIDALNYLTDLKAKENVNLVAVNNSWTGGGYSSALNSAINRAAKADILFVAAAGNAAVNTDTTANWPSNYSSLQATDIESAATYESVISVASITSSGALSSFSNWGTSTVDLGAPGSSITSTIPDGTYGSNSGTSMASPHVTGAIALLKSFNPTATAAQLRTAILNNAKPTTSLAGKTVTGGRLSLENLFIPPVVARYDPTVVSVSVPGAIKAGKSATVSVTVGNLGNTSTDVRVTLTPTNGTGSSTIVTVPGGGQVVAALNWQSPTIKGTYGLTSTAALVSTTIVDANPNNNSVSVTVKVA